MNPTARLLQDGGEAAASADFFRSAPFLLAEGATHSLVMENDRGSTALPLVVRTIPETDLHDAISPYGFPGGRGAEAAIDPHEFDLTALGLVSMFVRDRLDRPTFAGGTPRGEVFLHDPGATRSLSKGFRRDVARNRRSGVHVDLRPGGAVTAAELDDFVLVYTETMRHVGAAPRYFFDRDYLARCLEVPGSWLVLVRADDGACLAGELVVTSDGMMHSYLAGTASGARSSAPGKNGTLRVLELADELGLRLNVGGGVVADDGLAASKRSYSNATATFVTHELVCDPVAYRRLSPARSTTFFPAYRDRPPQ